jgi:23S rRNA (adenine2503-C2)-methyltransferase
VTENANQLVPLDPGGPAAESHEPLFGLDAESLTALLAKIGEPAWRGRQLAEAMYRQWLTDISEVTTLPSSLRRALATRGWRIDRPAIAKTFKSTDGTERYLIEFARPARGAETAEAVWMPEGDGGEAGDESEDGKTWDRATICVSSQLGCAVNCQFCLTAKLGLPAAAGNLSAGEIAGQVVAILARHAVGIGRDRVNLVFMGMGEPFLNYDSFMAAVRLLVREVGLSPQRMTVSTSGIVPGIERFALEPPDLRPKLAISLNAPNDEVRGEVMPINRKWPIASVVQAVRKVRLRPHERITFEYVLLGNVTDRPEHAIELARLLRRTGLPAKVNLIAWNPGPDLQYSTPKPESVERFQKALVDAGVPAYIRQPRGRDIFAACGQLKRTVEG